MKNTVLLTGGTGFIGKMLANRLRAAGYTILYFSHSRAVEGEQVMLDSTGLIPVEQMKNVIGIINLAGETISQRWTPEAKGKIRSSRINITNCIVGSLERMYIQGVALPEVMISTSAVGFYGPCPGGIITEDFPGGSGFLAAVCQEWETAAARVKKLGVRLVITRLGIVLAADGGMLARMYKPFLLGVGGIIGNGQQYISWIHREDVLAIVLLALRERKMEGVYNLTSPNPVTMQQLAENLGAVLRRPNWTSLPGWFVRLLFGEMAEEVLLANQNIMPMRIQKQQYTFLYSQIEPALRASFVKK